MLIVFGSINVDLVARVPRLPRPGETLAGSRFAMAPGGKGIDAVDTVGAGDACTAAIAAALDRGEAVSQAVREGVAAGSLACLREGAQDAAPTREEIARLAATLA
jgi:ribokinase